MSIPVNDPGRNKSMMTQLKGCCRKKKHALKYTCQNSFVQFFAICFCLLILEQGGQIGLCIF